MHEFILVEDDIYTLDTAEDRVVAARILTELGIEEVITFRGGPEEAAASGRTFCRDGLFGFSRTPQSLLQRVLGVFR